MILALIACACFVAVDNTGGAVRRTLGIDIEGAVYGTTRGPVVVKDPHIGAGGDTAANDNGPWTNHEEPGNKKNKKIENVHPHGGGSGNDNGRGNDDK